MSTPTLVGAIRQPNHYTARYVHWGTEPVPFLTVLRRILGRHLWSRHPSPC